MQNRPKAPQGHHGRHPSSHPKLPPSGRPDGLQSHEEGKEASHRDVEVPGLQAGVAGEVGGLGISDVGAVKAVEQEEEREERKEDIIELSHEAPLEISLVRRDHPFRMVMVMVVVNNVMIVDGCCHPGTLG